MSELAKQANKLHAELMALIAAVPNPIVKALAKSMAERFHALMVEIINKVEKN